MMRRAKRMQGFLAAVAVLVAAAMLLSGAEQVSAATTTTDAGTSDTVTYNSVHDPSVVVGYVESSVTSITSETEVKGVADETYNKEVYFLFGSHMAWSYSWDLMNWTSFRNNISTGYKTLFADEFAWAEMGDSVYDPSGNMWAPDVIWNADYENEDGSKGAWCMYMSINGCSWNSSICLLTAESLSGNWTYVGTVLYSGFTEEETHDYTLTDYTAVTGDTELAERYQTTAYTCYDDETACEDTTWNSNYGAHAIDPCLVYGDDGNLYMAYGSWSGGIYMIQLDASTGLRDYDVTYTNTDTSDPYMGYKLAGGNSVPGEGVYISKIGDYYYMFLSYGGLNADGGYNIRYYRSKSLFGDYEDINGASALDATNSYYSQVGVRTMSYYSWDYMTYGYAAEGHNSVLVDDDGSIYIVYHARSTDGTEDHSVRVHQMFVTEDDWLVVAPFEYSGESLDDSVSASDIAGMYEVIFQDETSYGGLGCNTGVAINFASDGTVSGNGYTGTWSWSSSKGAPYVDVTINGATYEGVFVEQRMENEEAAGASTGTAYSLGDTVMTFSIIQMTDTNGEATSNYQLSVWGFQYTETPSISSATNTSAGIKISWEEQTYAEDYIVYRKTASGSWTKLTTTSSRTYTDTTASSGTLYYYTIGYTSCDGTFTSGYGTNTKSIRRMAEPEVPTISATSTGLKVSWSAVGGAEKYIIYRKVGSNPWAEYATTTSTSYTDTSVSNGKTYSYSIRAYYSSTVQSTYSSTGSSFTYHRTTAITSVTNTSTGIKVKWSKVSGASTYEISRKTASGSWTRLTTTSDTSYSDTSVKNGTKYYYRVRVYQSSVNCSGYCSSVSSTYVKRPTLSSVKNSSTGVKVSWGKVSGATKYYVYRKTPSGDWEKLGSATSTSYTDKTAVNGTFYYYSVTAVNSSESAKAAYKKTVRLTVPTISSMKTVSSKSLTVKYKKNSKATGYQLQYATKDSFTNAKTVWIKSNSTLTKKITGLTKGKKYYVRIRAYKTKDGTKYYSAWSAKSKTVTK